MTDRVFVHLGPHKTGTTYLQGRIAANTQRLGDDGVFLPRRPRRALEELVWARPQAASPPLPFWDSLAASVRSSPEPLAILSLEGLAAAPARRIQRLVESLAPADIHVVWAMRDLTKVIPGVWQTRMRNNFSEDWATFLADIKGRTQAPVARRFWQGHDPRRALVAWEEYVPREHITVLTVPPPPTSAEVLWSRFCTVVGLDPSRYPPDREMVNASLGVAETEVVRRINACADLAEGPYRRLVQRRVIQGSLVRRANPTKLTLPASEHGWVSQVTNEIIEFLETGRYRVVGDLQEIVPRPTTTQTGPDDVDHSEALDAAVDVIVSLLDEIGKLSEPRTPQ
jgi:hypothetical protein